MEEDAEGVHSNHFPESESPELRLGLVDGCGQSGNRSDQGNSAERTLAAALVHDGVEQHDDHAEDRQHDLRQNANVVSGLGQRVRDLESRHYCPTALAAN